MKYTLLPLKDVVMSLIVLNAFPLVFSTLVSIPENDEEVFVWCFFLSHVLQIVVVVVIFLFISLMS